METLIVYGERYTLNMVKTNKFKTNRIQLSFGSDLNEETVSFRGLLPYLLKSVSKKYDTREALSAYLENLYAAGFSAGVSKVATTHFISFNLSFINDQYTLNNELLFDKALSFLNEVIFNPYFNEKIFEEEKRLLKEHFEGVYNNKLKYAVSETYKTMFENEIYRINALGIEEKLENIALSDCINAYEEMINNDHITINVVGDIDFDDVANKIKHEFSFKKRKLSLNLIDKSTKEFNKETEVVKKIDVKQAKLVIGYRLNTYYKSSEYYAAVVFNTLFGGSAESLLFKKIREELGLVYFINSSYDPYKGVLFIVSGINKEDYNKVLITIDNILGKIINQEYSNDDLEISKKIQVNGLIESLDSNIGILSRISRDSLFNNPFNPEEVIKNLNLVTKEEISSVAKTLRKDTIFLLRDDKDE